MFNYKLFENLQIFVIVQCIPLYKASRSSLIYILK